MSAATDFAKLRTLPVAGAIDYMRTRMDLTVTHDWQDLWHEEHARQFTVSRLARLDLLQAVREGIARSVAGDLSRRDWMRDTEALLAQAGWWGEKQVRDPSTGEVVTTTFNPARLALIFDVNTRQAWAAGQWQRIQAAKRTHPYLRYVTRDDGRVRAQHRAWHNVVLPVDDAFWHTHFPPNGWRCRCRVVALSRREYERGYSESRLWTPPPDKRLLSKLSEKERAEVVATLGAEYNSNSPAIREPFKTQAPRESTVEHVNRRTGEVSRVPTGIDPGFGYNVGLAREQVLAQMAEAKLRAAEKALADAARKAGLQVPQIAKEVAGQPSWKTLGLPDLRQVTPRAEAPQMLPHAPSWEAAVSQLRGALGVPVGAARSVRTPVGDVTILDELLPHVVEKRQDGRERYADFVLPTLMSPDEVWDTAYDDGTQRRRFIKLFSGSKYDVMTVVRQEPNGTIFWNVIIRERKGMNTLRVGALVHEALSK